MGYGESDLHAPYLFRSGCYSYRYRSMRYRGLRDGDHQLRVWIDAEDISEENIAKYKSLVDYARGKGVELGCYSLLSSRWISDEVDVINPKTGKRGGMRFGSAPCLCSDWDMSISIIYEPSSSVRACVASSTTAPIPATYAPPPTIPIIKGWKIPNGISSIR